MTDDTHDLALFLKRATDEIASEYSQIQRHATEDPGTAGDQGEENWATLFRNWLPPTYHVVTKGRILGLNGTPSRQVDVIVLNPTYPKHLLNQKLYLAGGVAAAFECKLTLKAQHIKKAVENAGAIRRLLPPRIGTPHKELNSPMIYGVLAHSHSWKSPKSKPIDIVNKCLIETDLSFTQHPREMIDLICVADLALWKASKIPWFGPESVPYSEESLPEWAPRTGVPLTSFMCHSMLNKDQPLSFSPIGAAVAFLLCKIAWEDVTIREIARYFTMVNLSGFGISERMKVWKPSIYSPTVHSQINTKISLLKAINDDWDEWNIDG